MKIGSKNSQSHSSHKYQKGQNITKDLLAGSVAGVISTFAGHPLDTIKTRMQVLDDRFWSCCKMMMKKEGITSLYKGVQSPLVSTPFTTAISFGSYEVSKRILGINREKKVTFNQGLMAGGLAGFFYAGISTPIELIKCRLQMQDIGTKAKGKGSINMIMNILRKEGVLGLYKGYGITCLRDIPGGAVQFGAYELFKGLLNKRKNTTDSASSNFIAGGLAKFTTWFVCHPQDLIKTKLQCNPSYQGVIECSKEVWQRYGSAGFWRGSLPSIVRTLISGAVTFAVYEEAQKFFSEIC